MHIRTIKSLLGRIFNEKIQHQFHFSLSLSVSSFAVLVIYVFDLNISCYTTTNKYKKVAFFKKSRFKSRWQMSSD